MAPLNWDLTEAVQGVPHAFYAYPGTEKTCISAFPASLEAVSIFFFLGGVLFALRSSFDIDT